jgi:hypothetical protein
MGLFSFCEGQETRRRFFIIETSTHLFFSGVLEGRIHKPDDQINASEQIPGNPEVAAGVVHLKLLFQCFPALSGLNQNDSKAHTLSRLQVLQSNAHEGAFFLNPNGDPGRFLGKR